MRPKGNAMEGSQYKDSRSAACDAVSGQCADAPHMRSQVTCAHSSDDLTEAVWMAGRACFLGGLVYAYSNSGRCALQHSCSATRWASAQPCSSWHGSRQPSSTTIHKTSTGAGAHGCATTRCSQSSSAALRVSTKPSFSLPFSLPTCLGGRGGMKRPRCATCGHTREHLALLRWQPCRRRVVTTSQVRQRHAK